MKGLLMQDLMKVILNLLNRNISIDKFILKLKKYLKLMRRKLSHESHLLVRSIGSGPLSAFCRLVYY